MLHYSVKFKHSQTGEVKIIEYPKMLQWANRDLLSKFLHERDFLSEYIVEEIKEYDPIKTKNELAKSWGKLIYS